MKRKIKKHKNGMIILVLIMVISIGYAAATAAVNMSGTAFLKGNKFEVHFENVSEKTGSVVANSPAEITDKTNVTFMTELPNPGDKYEFTVDVVNSGTIDAMINTIEKTGLTPEQEKLIAYKVTYGSTRREINKYDLIEAGKTLKLNVLLQFREDITPADLEATTLGNLDFGIYVDYTSADERAVPIKVEPAKGPTMINIGYKNNYDKLSEMKSYYPNLETVVLNDSINVPEGVPNWDISEAGNGTVMAYVVPNVADASKYDLHIEGEGGISAPIDSNSLFLLTFEDKSDITPTYSSIIGLEKLNTSEVTNMSYMFSGSPNITNLNLSSLDTNNATNMECMFGGCKNLRELDLSKFNTSKVTDMSGMFSSISATSLNLSNFKTSQVTNMRSMFSGCENLTELNLSNFDTSQVTEMGTMFDGCLSLTSLNVCNFNTSQVTDMSRMFSNCYKLTSLDLSNFNTSQVTDVNNMFINCKILTSIDLRNADFSNVRDMYGMLNSVPNNITIKVKDEAAKTFIETRLSDASVTGTVEIATA